MRRALLLTFLLGLVLAGSSRAQDEGDERDAILALINPRRGEAIADVGCGRGDWTLVLAHALGPTGSVYAVDIDPDAIATVKERVAKEGLENVTARQSVPDDPMLPADSLDAVFLNDVIDWVERRALAGFLAGLRGALKQDGRLIIRDPSGDPDRVISECYRNGFALVEAKIPLPGAPARSFGTSWYALKLRRSHVQHPLLPRLGRPATRRTRLYLAEELYRMGLFTRDELRAKWEALRDAPGNFDPEVDEALDLVQAARGAGVLTDAEATELAKRARGS
jgi:SAM-dependent methyltransferase